MGEEAHLPHPFRTSPHRVYLRRGDFANGPVHITQPDTYVTFRESVVLNFPEPSVTTSPFHLGFFAALCIEAPRVVVDLGGHSIRQSDEFRRRQRFFALISLQNSPFPPGKARGFTTPLKSPTDISIINGTLADSSHFGIHGVECGDRILIDRVRIERFEVSAISISGASDVTVRRCTIGQAAPPKTSSELVMLRDLSATAKANGQHDASATLMKMTAHPRVAAPEHSDALVRSIVIGSTFNVGRPNLSEKRRIARVTLSSLKFKDVHAEPREVVGIATHSGGEALKDTNGNLISFSDASSGAFLSRIQASLSPELPSGARSRLMRGAAAFTPVYGLDLRGHDLRMKASLFGVVSSCDSVTCRGIQAGRVRSVGKSSAAVGFMFNACSDVKIVDMNVKSVEVTDECVSTLSDERPQGALYARQCRHLTVDRMSYQSRESCSCALRDTEEVKMTRCSLSAPLTASNVSNLSLRD